MAVFQVAKCLDVFLAELQIYILQILYHVFCYKEKIKIGTLLLKEDIDYNGSGGTRPETIDVGGGGANAPATIKSGGNNKQQPNETKSTLYVS